MTRGMRNSDRAHARHGGINIARRTVELRLTHARNTHTDMRGTAGKNMGIADTRNLDIEIAFNVIQFEIAGAAQTDPDGAPGFQTAKFSDAASFATGSIVNP